MTIFHIIKNWLQTKIYHACLNIEKEREIKKRNEIFSNIIFRGAPLTLGDRNTIWGAQYMEFGDSCFFGNDVWIECRDSWNDQTFSPILKVGDKFRMQNNCHIGCIENIEIGNNVLLGSKVYITDHFHGDTTKESITLPPFERRLTSKPVKIGNNVWIGDNVCIMPGVTLGDNVIVGANAVVTHSFPCNSVIAGVPAKLLKTI